MLEPEKNVPFSLSTRCDKDTMIAPHLTHFYLHYVHVKLLYDIQIHIIPIYHHVSYRYVYIYICIYKYVYIIYIYVCLYTHIPYNHISPCMHMIFHAIQGHTHTRMHKMTYYKVVPPQFCLLVYSPHISTINPSYWSYKST